MSDHSKNNSRIAQSFAIANQLFAACNTTRPWIQFREDTARALNKPPHSWPLRMAYELVADHAESAHQVWAGGGSPEVAAKAVWEARKNYGDSYNGDKTPSQLAKKISWF